MKFYLPKLHSKIKLKTSGIIRINPSHLIFEELDEENKKGIVPKYHQNKDGILFPFPADTIFSFKQIKNTSFYQYVELRINKGDCPNDKRLEGHKFVLELDEINNLDTECLL